MTPNDAFVFNFALMAGMIAKTMDSFEKTKYVNDPKWVKAMDALDTLSDTFEPLVIEMKKEYQK